MITLHYSTKNWRQGVNSLDSVPMCSLEEAKAAIPDNCTFAVIFTEDGEHRFSPTFKWESYVN